MDDLDLDPLESVAASIAADHASSRLARLYRWIRVLAFGVRLLPWALILAAVVATFAYY
jgi:hypothetical protein